MNQPCIFGTTLTFISHSNHFVFVHINVRKLTAKDIEVLLA